MKHRTVNLVEVDADMLAYCTIVRDGDPKDIRIRGNFLGLFGIPPQGGYFWHAENGDYGYCESEAEALEEIQAAAKRGIEPRS